VASLLVTLVRERGMGMVFISHDLSVVRQIADRVAVMYLGRVREIAEVEEFFERPLHPYSEALLSAVPVPEVGHARQRRVLKGEIASPIAPPSGCVFRTRCPYAIEDCARIVPKLEPMSSTRAKACIRNDIMT
jgi:oligopeptide/dipeptide ABC transporter ATP-binding protein